MVLFQFMVKTVTVNTLQRQTSNRMVITTRQTLWGCTGLNNSPIKWPPYSLGSDAIEKHLGRKYMHNFTPSFSKSL